MSSHIHSKNEHSSVTFGYFDTCLLMFQSNQNFQWDMSQQFGTQMRKNRADEIEILWSSVLKVWNQQLQSQIYQRIIIKDRITST